MGLNKQPMMTYILVIIIYRYVYFPRTVFDVFVCWLVIIRYIHMYMPVKKPLSL